MQEKPRSALTAVTGIVETTGKGLQLRVDRSWTKAVATLPLTGSTCSLGLTEGQRYLLLSIVPADFIQDYPANVCQAVAVKLEDAASLIAKLAK